MQHLKTPALFVILILFIAAPDEALAQQFGRNKVIYDDFDFRILETPHFRIHHYLEDEEEILEFAQLTERWYERHLPIFLDTIRTRIPIILYNNHADFQQTTVIQQLIGIGTGGVTEGMRKRVVMPLSPSRRQTDHVLGHELTHVHHFRLFLGNGGPGMGGRAMQNTPLWMVEGQSEYLSIGRQDPHTAMWMRDAVKHDNIPTVRDMTINMQEYFPYRWGHAFWAFFTGHYGDAQVLPLFVTTAQWGLERAIDSITGYSSDELSAFWADDLRSTFRPLMEGKQESVGEPLFDASNAGRMNIAPSISPDGENLVFISDLDVIAIGFFLGNVREKEVTRQITGILRDAHIDEYNYMESAGTWSPDGRRYAISVFSRGRNRLAIADLGRRRTRTFDVPGVVSFNNPSWSPDGENIVISGMVEGKSNLYLFNLATRETRQLTDDRYAALQPSWSPDGSKITFITDREGNTDFDIIRFGNYRVAEYDVNEGKINIIDILPGADIVNPKYSPDGRYIFFVSNADGFRNIYRYEPDAGEILRVTDLQVGVSGITELSPCFDIASETGDLVYILYNNTGYELYIENIDRLGSTVFTADDVDLSAAVLPPADPPVSIVDVNLERFPLTDTARFRTVEYEPEFGLEFIGSAGIGMGVSQFGVGAAGGVSFMFSDLLRENLLMTALQVQGRLIDVSGQVAYLNQGSRLNWGGVFSHIPFRSAGAFVTEDQVNGTDAMNLVVIEQRVFEQELGTFAQYPLSRFLRFEGGVSASMYSFRVDSINNYYVGNRLMAREEFRGQEPESFFMFRTHLAYVGDQSRFGLTSPMDGYRYRFQVDRSFGEYSFWGLRGDYRQYFFMNPLSLGIRLMHFGRYGPDANQLQPIFLGNPYLVRGYNFRSITRTGQTSEHFISINNMLGSKIAVANAELRLPFTGPRELALIRSRMFFSDLVLFADSGLAWNEFEDINFTWRPNRDNGERIPIVSTGLALRMNLFGAIIVEPYFTIPFQRRADTTTGTLGFHFSFGGF
jgi:Tol biopolymer transport system component